MTEFRLSPGVVSLTIPVAAARMRISESEARRLFDEKDLAEHFGINASGQIFSRISPGVTAKTHNVQ